MMIRFRAELCLPSSDSGTIRPEPSRTYSSRLPVASSETSSAVSESSRLSQDCLCPVTARILFSNTLS